MHFHNVLFINGYLTNYGQKRSRNDAQDLGLYGNYYCLLANSQYLNILNLFKFSNCLYLVK
jgi:hypothetical protein